jgi:hypothetical protein
LEGAVPVGVEGTAATAIGATATGVGALPPNDTQLSFSREIGESGKYKDVRRNADKDNNQAHHMPSQKHLKDNEMNTDEGFAAVIPEQLHRETRSFGKKAANLDTSNPYRTELGRDIKDYVGILKRNGLWTPEVRESFKKGLDNFKTEFPDLFRRITK